MKVGNCYSPYHWINEELKNDDLILDDDDAFFSQKDLMQVNSMPMKG